MKTRIKDWFRRRGSARRAVPGAYFTVLFDPEGRLLVCEGGVWKVFELDEAGRVRGGSWAPAG